MALGQLASEVWAVTGLIAPATWAVAVVAPAVLAFSAARWLLGRVRLLVLLIILLLPIWLLTLPMIYLPPAPPSAFAWWLTGMVMIAPVASAWAVIGVLGAKVGWRYVR